MMHRAFAAMETRQGFVWNEPTKILSRVHLNQRVRPWVVLSAALLIFSSTKVFSSGLPNIYPSNELSKKITRQQAVENFKASGFKLVQEDFADKRITIRDPETNKVVGSLFFCNDILFSNSVAVDGGASAMIRRASQFNSAYGDGVVSAKSSLGDVGEINTLTLSWNGVGGEAEIQFTSASGRLNESQWVSYSYQSVCR